MIFSDYGTEGKSKIPFSISRLKIDCVINKPVRTVIAGASEGFPSLHNRGHAYGLHTSKVQKSGTYVLCDIFTCSMQVLVDLLVFGLLNW